jgi:hypothetical protein
MADLALEFGGDLLIGPTGDLLLVDGSELTQQRVLRRLLTNPGDYIWQLSYGAGLGQYVGLPGVGASVVGISRAQMLLESGVGISPAPVITAFVQEDGKVTLSLKYADASDGASSTLTFSI